MLPPFEYQGCSHPLNTRDPCYSLVQGQSQPRPIRSPRHPTDDTNTAAQRTIRTRPPNRRYEHDSTAILMETEARHPLSSQGPGTGQGRQHGYSHGDRGELDKADAVLSWSYRLLCGRVLGPQVTELASRTPSRVQVPRAEGKVFAADCAGIPGQKNSRAVVFVSSAAGKPRRIAQLPEPHPWSKE